MQITSIIFEYNSLDIPLDFFPYKKRECVCRQDTCHKTTLMASRQANHKRYLSVLSMGRLVISHQSPQHKGEKL